LDYENGRNPFDEVRNRIAVWKELACVDCERTADIDIGAEKYMKWWKVFLKNPLTLPLRKPLN
jgi:hypothetical protein